MTEQLAVMMHLMDFGEKILRETNWNVEQFREQMEDFLEPHTDDWECAVISRCVADLLSYVLSHGHMPESIEVMDYEDVGPKVMHRYMEIAWRYVSHEMFGDEIPIRYATST